MDPGARWPGGSPAGRLGASYLTIRASVSSSETGAGAIPPQVTSRAPRGLTELVFAKRVYESLERSKFPAGRGRQAVTHRRSGTQGRQAVTHCRSGTAGSCGCWAGLRWACLSLPLHRAPSTRVAQACCGSWVGLGTKTMKEAVSGPLVGVPVRDRSA